MTVTTMTASQPCAYRAKYRDGFFEDDKPPQVGLAADLSYTLFIFSVSNVGLCGQQRNVDPCRKHLLQLEAAP